MVANTNFRTNMKTRRLKTLITFVIVFLIGCGFFVKAGENIRDVAISNAILNFSNSCKLFKNDLVFSVSFEDTVFLLALNLETAHRYREKFYEDLVLVSISAHRICVECEEDGLKFNDRFLYTAETTIGSKGKLPSRHIEKGGKLFYWWDDDYPLTEEMLAILWKYDLLFDDTERLVVIPQFSIDDRLKGAHYYFCKNDLSKFKRVITNIAHGYYKPPKLKCK